MSDERPELIERLKLAYAEYRAEVALGWDRQKLFLTLSPTLTALVNFAPARAELLRIGTLVVAALVSLAGALIVHRSHGRYRAARAVVLRLENSLGIDDLQTTGGQRAERGNMRHERFRVVDVIVWVFVLIALLDVALAVFG